MEDETLTQEQSEYLDIVRKRSKHLNTLITQLYEYTRLTNHELKLHMEALDLRLLLQEHLLSFIRNLKQRESACPLLSGTIRLWFGPTKTPLAGFCTT